MYRLVSLKFLLLVCKSVQPRSWIRAVNDQLVLQRYMDSLVECSNKWGIKYNAKKCESIRMCRKRNPLTKLYTIRARSYEICSARYLLVWTSQTNLTVALTTKKANGTLAFPHGNLKTCSEKIKKNAYTIYYAL